MELRKEVAGKTEKGKTMLEQKFVKCERKRGEENSNLKAKVQRV